MKTGKKDLSTSSIRVTSVKFYTYLPVTASSLFLQLTIPVASLFWKSFFAASDKTGMRMT
jgi:hypothetical protein